MERNVRRRKISERVDLQVSLLIAIFVATVALTCCLVFYHMTYNDMRVSLNERVEIIHQYLTKQLDMTAFSDFESRDAITTEEYLLMHDVFSAVKDATGVMYLYTAKKNAEGKYIYVVDGLDIKSSDFRYPGDIIEEEIYQDMDRALGGEVVYPDEILHTSWGDIFICYLPLYNQGDIIGVLGIEFEAEHQYDTYRKLELFAPIAVILFTILAFLTSRVLFWRINEIVVNEANQKEALAEALRREEIASKAKSSFLFNISHDIRTPMNVIVGFTQIARDHINDKERVDDSLAKVEDASLYLRRLINDVLDMARIEKGKLEIEIAPFCIKDSIKETEQMFRPQMEEKGIFFEVEMENIQEHFVLCDGLRLKQIALNLLSNALKYTKKGGRVIYKVGEKMAEEGYTQVEIMVKDTGIGMAEEFQKHIFGVFEKEKSATESGVDGVGLGLAITKELVRLHGGTIEVSSKKGEGTEFLVHVKLKVVEKKEDAKEDTLLFEGKRVLLVEDNPLNREIAEVLLTEEGFKVECAEDGVIAVEMVSESESGYYDLVLMDIQMPRMDGYQATKEIRKLSDIGLANIPIVALTANALTEDKQKAFESGMDGHVAKPIDMEKFKYMLKEVLLNSPSNLERNMV